MPLQVRKGRWCFWGGFCRNQSPEDRAASLCRMWQGGQGEVVPASSTAGQETLTQFQCPEWAEQWELFHMAQPELVGCWKYHPELADVVFLKGGMESWKVIWPLSFCSHLNSIMKQTFLEREKKGKQMDRELMCKNVFQRQLISKLSWCLELRISSRLWWEPEMRDRLFGRTSWGTDLGFYLFACYILV